MEDVCVLAWTKLLVPISTLCSIRISLASIDTPSSSIFFSFCDVVGHGTYETRKIRSTSFYYHPLSPFVHMYDTTKSLTSTSGPLIWEAEVSCRVIRTDLLDVCTWMHSSMASFNCLETNNRWKSKYLHKLGAFHE